MTNKVDQKQFLATLTGQDTTEIVQTGKPPVLNNSAAVVQAQRYEYERQNETAEDRKFINWLFSQLEAAFRSGFYELKNMDEAERNNHMGYMRRQWMDAFKRAEINDSRLVTYAINRMLDRGDKFIPVVGEFLALCEEGKIPAGTKSHVDAWKEIKGWLMQSRDRRKSSDLSNEVFNTISAELEDRQAFEERTNSPEQREAWHQAYTKTLNKLKNGQPIRFAPPPNQMSLEKKPSKPATKEFAASFLEEMRKGL